MKDFIIVLACFMPSTCLRLYLRKIEVDVALAFSAFFGMTAYMVLHYFYLPEMTSAVIAIGSHILLRAEGRNAQP